MKLRILLTLYIIIGLPIALLAQRRQLQEARAIIKSGKNYDQAEKMMTKLLKDSANLHKPRIYEMWLTSVEKQYDQVNEAMYKKQTVDIGPLSEDKYYEIGEDYNGKFTVNDLTGTITGINENRIITPEYSGNIYSLDGRLVRTDGKLENLPKGIYIVNKKKVILK